MNPVQAGPVCYPRDWIWSSVNDYVGMRAEEQKSCYGLVIDRVRMPSNPGTLIWLTSFEEPQTTEGAVCATCSRGESYSTSSY